MACVETATRVVVFCKYDLTIEEACTIDVDGMFRRGGWGRDVFMYMGEDGTWRLNGLDFVDKEYHLTQKDTVAKDWVLLGTQIAPMRNTNKKQKKVKGERNG